jgi:carbonic anhydrase
MIEIGTKDEASHLLQHVFEKIDEIKKPGTITETGPLDFKELARHLSCSTVYQYGGSLTTPPCTEGIAWNVVKEPIYLDVKTYKKVKKVVKFNARYTQNKPANINLLDNARNVLDGKN